MRVLVTGSEGGIGRHLAPALRDAGYELRTFDRVAGPEGEHGHVTADLRDRDVVRRVVRGVDAVVHLGAIAGDVAGREHEVLTVNVEGTWNVLLAAAEFNVPRVVYFSSVNALGNVGGLRPSACLPIDDAYPPHPVSAYQLSKRLGEEICRAFAAQASTTALCLRPTLVAAPDHHYPDWRDADAAELAHRGSTEYWAYVDVRDVCAATLLGLTADVPPFSACLLAAADTMAKTPTAELVDRFYPDTDWPTVDRSAFLGGAPHCSLVDCAEADRLLGWRPRHGWR